MTKWAIEYLHLSGSWVRTMYGPYESKKAAQKTADWFQYVSDVSGEETNHRVVEVTDV